MLVEITVKYHEQKSTNKTQVPGQYHRRLTLDRYVIDHESSLSISMPCSSNLARASRDILPGGAKAAACAGKKAFLFFLLGILLREEILHSGGAEERGNKDD